MSYQMGKDGNRGRRWRVGDLCVERGPGKTWLSGRNYLLTKQKDVAIKWTH